MVLGDNHTDPTAPRVLEGQQLQLLMDNRPASPLARLGSGVVYLDLTRLDDNTDVYTGDAATHDLSALVRLLADAGGLVFDMRGYPGWTLPIELLGHLTDRPLSTAPMYMPVITRPDAGMMLVDITYEWAQSKLPRFTHRVAFLINSSAASRTEHILAMVEGYKLGELVGTPTAGANGTYAGVSFFDLYTSSWSSLKANRFGNEPLFARASRRRFRSPARWPAFVRGATSSLKGLSRSRQGEPQRPCRLRCSTCQERRSGRDMFGGR